MLARYEGWRSKYFLPPVTPWDGRNAFPPAPDSPPIPLPPSLNGSAFPSGWTTTDLGNAVRAYYKNLRTYVNSAGDGMELDDEVKAPYSYRYWAFMKWASDLRKRLLGQPVFHVHEVYDKDGTVLSEKDFTDIFHRVHHIWHTSGEAPQWTVATPFFKTGAGQHRQKKEISRTQIGAEFFAFHRDHLEIYDRWLVRTKQDKTQSINTCAHDTNPNDTAPVGVDTGAPGNPNSGHPHIDDWSTNPPTVVFNDPHGSYWEGTLPHFSNLGEMGQFFARDANPFVDTTLAKTTFGTVIPVAGASDSGYHGEGHVLNGDLFHPVPNNHSPRFFAWHGFIDDIWVKREHRFLTFGAVHDDNSDFPAPGTLGTLTILRDFTVPNDLIEPGNAIIGLDVLNGQGTVRVKIRVRPDPFNRPLELALRCEVLREAGGTTPVIALPVRNLEIIPMGAPTPSQRLQDADFFEGFVFNGSAGTMDSDGDGPFKPDNIAFPPSGPSAAGFKNSRIRISGYLVCRQRTNGTIPAVSGSLSSSGTAVTGGGTSFTTQLRQGDLIRANGQVRMVVFIGSNTSLILLESFSPNLPVGTAFERLDGYDHESVIEIPLIQEKQAPDIAIYLDRSTFSLDQVNAVASGGQSVFSNAFYLALQDRTSRPLNIVWPPEVEPALHGLIAPPVYGAGLYADPIRDLPVVELRDATTDTRIPDVDVSATAAQPEDPSLPPGIPQRITYPCQVVFTGTGAFAGLVNPGDVNDVKLVVTARDRSGNEVTDETKRVRLQINANPYMLDGPTSWLSIDTRVFKIPQAQARFGVATGWTNPNTFIKDVIENFRAGGGTAGGETFDSLPTDQSAAVLEYATALGGQNIFNFALAKVRLQSQTGVANVRASFRLLRWGVANVEFNNTLTYRSALSGVAMLGRTSSNELASIPFYAEPRRAVSEDMAALQTDPKNLDNFGSTGGGEATKFYGAYLDINQTTLRFPDTFLGDGGFSGVPAAQMRSVRDLLVGHHQCMVVEIMDANDPTVVGATPGTSDNLSQRNLLIVQTANPGNAITRTVQHAFNIDLTRNRQHWRGDHDHHDDDHGPDDGHRHDEGTNLHRAARHAGQTHEEECSLENFLECNCCEEIEVRPARPPIRRATGNGDSDHHMFSHLGSGWLAQFPEALELFKERALAEHEKQRRWTFDAIDWKPTLGLDELAFFWNNLPKDAEVELYLPGASAEEIVNFRNLRHAPDTVKLIDSQTLRLFPIGTTYLPIPPFYGENLAGLITVTLPAGIKKGQRYTIDVLQLRAEEARALGGFQLNIQVERAFELWQAENRTLELFDKRLSLTRPDDRWRPIVEKQVGFTRQRAKDLVDLANEEQPGQPPLTWTDPTETQKGQKVRVVLEKIQILDDREPFFKGKGEFRFFAKVFTPDNGGMLKNAVFPATGHFSLGDKPGNNEVALEATLFEGFVEKNLAIEIGGLELDTFDPDDRLCVYKRAFPGEPAHWLGSYHPDGRAIDLQNVGGWKLWYRIEYAG